MNANIKISRYARNDRIVVIPNKVRNLWGSYWMPDNIGHDEFFRGV